MTYKNREPIKFTRKDSANMNARFGKRRRMIVKAFLVEYDWWCEQ